LNVKGKVIYLREGYVKDKEGKLRGQKEWIIEN
jgi:hypothetical protein